MSGVFSKRILHNFEKVLHHSHFFGRTLWGY